jgi:hypothetical protein
VGSDHYEGLTEPSRPKSRIIEKALSQVHEHTEEILSLEKVIVRYHSAAPLSSVKEMISDGIYILTRRQLEKGQPILSTSSLTADELFRTK